MSRRTVLVSRRDSTGAVLAERLAASPACPDLATVEPAQADAAALAGAGLVVIRPPRTARGFPGPDLAAAGAVFAACRAAGVERVILVASTAVCEPSHQNAGMAAEPRALPSPTQRRARNCVARRWAELEALAAASLAGIPFTIPLTILRAAPVAARDAEELLPRLVAARLAIAVAGFDPSIQLLAPADLAEAVVRAAESAPVDSAVYQVVPRGTVPVRAAIRLAGGWQVRLPWSLQRLARAALAPLGLAATTDELAWARHPATVSGEKAARELGFAARATSAEAALALRSRRVGSPEAAPDFDPYGQDRAYVDAYGRTLFRFLHDRYWRVEWRGLEHVPRQGGAVLTGVHRGFMPWDGCMLLHLLARELGRYPRFLIHPCLVKMPFLANYMTKLGGLLACQENADFVLGRGELLGMFPEGIHGAFTMYRDAYRLGKFGRDEYVKMALRNRAPIVPFVTVGSAEIYPILGRIDSRLVRRVTEWPFLPLAPNFPFPGLPLPSKWHTRFLAPLDVHKDHPPEAADDPAAVAAIGREVRGRMEAAIGAMLARRRSIFRGSVFDGAEAGEGNVTR